MIASTSDLFSETTVFADQSSRLINEQEQSSGLNTSKTMIEQRNPLLEGEDENLYAEVEMGFDDTDDLLLADVENDMNSFVMHHKDAQERLKSIRLTQGRPSATSMSQFDQNELQKSGSQRKSTLAGEQSHLKDLENQFSDM